MSSRHRTTRVLWLDRGRLARPARALRAGRPRSIALLARALSRSVGLGTTHAAALVLLAGCAGRRSPLAPASTQAGAVAGLWWIFLAVLVTVFALVLVWLAIAIARGRGTIPAEVAAVAPHRREPGREKRMTVLIGALVAATVAILFGLLIADFSVGRALQPPAMGDALTIKITGKQWWWQIEYLDRQASNNILTANEFHLPVGRPVQLLLESADVIHSFWLPNLQGKKDLIPGRQTSLWITPDRPGLFKGQCAEFCGYQHAHMGLTAIVESPEDFARWQEAQRQSARAPATDSQRKGQEVFLRRSCVMCHTVQGTPANSRIGPSLTHFAGRQTLAAGTFPNNRGHLAGWIMDPQAMKPGVRMPSNDLSPDELHDLLDYLQSLQ